MERLIDADKIVNGIALYMAENAYLNDTPLDALKMVANWITEATHVDAVEVVHGYTIPAEEPKKVLLDRKCGICDQLMLSTDVFCPMCGARMDGDMENNRPAEVIR